MRVTIQSNVQWTISSSYVIFDCNFLNGIINAENLNKIIKVFFLDVEILKKNQSKFTKIWSVFIKN